MKSKKMVYFFIIGLLGLLVMIFETTNNSDQKETLLNVYITNSSLTGKDGIEIMDHFKSGFLKDNSDKSEYVLHTDLSLSISEPNPEELFDAGRMTSQIAGKELDLFISRNDIIDHYYRLNGFEALNALIDERFDLSPDRVLKHNEDIYAIKVKVESDGNNTEDFFWAAIPKTSEKKELATEFIVYLTKER